MNNFQFSLINWLPPILTALSVGLLIHALTSSVVDLYQRGLKRRLRLAVRLATRSTTNVTHLPGEAEVYGLPRTSLPALMGAAAIGLLMSMLAFDGPLRPLGLLAGLFPLLWRRRQLAQARLTTRQQIAELIEDLRLRLAFSGTLGAALALIVDDADRSGVVMDRLRLHRDRLALEGPEAVLQRLADELRSRELRLLLARVRAARLGGGSTVEALRAAADDVAAEITRQVEAEIEGAPLRLVFPMLILLLPPVLALALYPPASLLINALTGAGPSSVPGR